MLYEFSETLKKIAPKQIDESRLSAGVVSLDLLKNGLGAQVGFGAGLIEECERTEGRFRSAVDMADGHLFAIVSVRELSDEQDARDRVGLFVKQNLMLIVSLRDEDESIPAALEETLKRLNSKTVSLERLNLRVLRAAFKQGWQRYGAFRSPDRGDGGAN